MLESTAVVGNRKFEMQNARCRRRTRFAICSFQVVKGVSHSCISVWLRQSLNYNSVVCCNIIAVAAPPTETSARHEWPVYSPLAFALLKWKEWRGFPCYSHGATDYRERIFRSYSHLAAYDRYHKNLNLMQWISNIHAVI